LAKWGKLAFANAVGLNPSFSKHKETISQPLLTTFRRPGRGLCLAAVIDKTLYNLLKN
jgi:hypothetical protein